MACYENLCAAGEKGFRGGEADAVGAADDDCGFICVGLRHFLFPFLFPLFPVSCSPVRFYSRCLFEREAVGQDMSCYGGDEQAGGECHLHGKGCLGSNGAAECGTMYLFACDGHCYLW